MDRIGADYFSVVNQIRDRLNANAVTIHIPIGAEADFRGLVDLIEMKAIVWYDDAQLGTNYKYIDIPEDLVETANEYRAKLIESVAELDDTLLSASSKILIQSQLTRLRA